MSWGMKILRWYLQLWRDFCMTETKGTYAKQWIQRQNLLHQLVALRLQNVAHPHRSRVDTISSGIVHGRRRWRSVGVRCNCSCIRLDVVQSRRHVFYANAELNLLNLLDADDSRRDSDTQAYRLTDTTEFTRLDIPPVCVPARTLESGRRISPAIPLFS